MTIDCVLSPWKEEVNKRIRRRNFYSWTDEWKLNTKTRAKGMKLNVFVDYFYDYQSVNHEFVS